MAYRLTLRTTTEASVVKALSRVSNHPRKGGVPVKVGDPSHLGLLPHLLQDPTTGHHFLGASDGEVVRLQHVVVFHTVEALELARANMGPANNGHPLLVLLESTDWDEDGPLNLQETALVLTPGSGSRTWDLSRPESVQLERILRAHLRPIPQEFRSWFVLLGVGPLARFCATFPEGLEPPVQFIPEAFPSEPGGPATWAKFWAYHATTGDPLGVVMGVRSKEALARFSPKK